MYASGCFMLTYGRNQYNIAKQLSSNLKQILKKEVEITSVHSFKSIILLKLKKKKSQGNGPVYALLYPALLLRIYHLICSQETFLRKTFLRKILACGKWSRSPLGLTRKGCAGIPDICSFSYWLWWEIGQCFLLILPLERN